MSSLPLKANKSSPSIKILPEVASVNLEMHRRSVDFPEPTLPIIATFSPAFILKDIFLISEVRII